MSKRFLGDLIPAEVADGLPEGTKSLRIIESPSAQMCLQCRAAKLLCGRPRCPILVRATQYVVRSPRASRGMFSGTSPPGVFVGRMGYPKISVGPLVTADLTSVELADSPEAWLNLSMADIIGFRYSLLRGRTYLRADAAAEPGRSLGALHELALATKPVSTELQIMSSPSFSMMFSDDVQPIGPSASYRGLRTSGSTSDGRIERVYYDTDLKAEEAVTGMYSSGVEVSRIQKAFSIGMTGLKQKRRLVPTRWSITAVDSILSNYLMDIVRTNPLVNETRVYIYKHMESTYVGYIFPRRWSFEWVEGWQPNTVWNVGGAAPELIGDSEGFQGRSSYAEPGGCYYSARLAAAEYLSREGRAGAVVLLREIHPGYIIPLGVWTVREALRELFRKEPVRYSNESEAVSYGVSRTSIPKTIWFRKARLLAEIQNQRKLTDFS